MGTEMVMLNLFKRLQGIVKPRERKERKSLIGLEKSKWGWTASRPKGAGSTMTSEGLISYTNERENAIEM